MDNTTALPLIEGLIIDGSRGIYHVETSTGTYLCTIRGKLYKQLTYPTSKAHSRSVREVKVKTRDPISVGDRVQILMTDASHGVIEAVIARANGAFTRRDPGKGQSDLTSVAGLDQMLIVFAARDPEPHLGMLDRFLTVAEQQEITALICVNKADLGVSAALDERLAIYSDLGYQMLRTATTTGEGVENVRRQLAGHTTALLGPSGVGKSSLLNALEPDLAQRVSHTSEFTGKGRHTTTGTRLCAISGPEGGYIADTAGIRALALSDETTDRLDWCFREFRPYLGACRLSDCTHLHEPGCAVRLACEDGAITSTRYASYGRIRTGGKIAAVDEWAEVE